MKKIISHVLAAVILVSIIPCSASVFEYCIATKGPLSLMGNIELGGCSVSVEGSVYIESENSDEALSIIGNSQIAGDVKITNPDGVVTLQGGQAMIGGETGPDAIDNHVVIGVPPIEFPVPNPNYFERYVQNTFDPLVDDTSVEATYENIRIPAGTNPVFSGNITLRGVVYIETPNNVTFTGSVEITGIFVGDGDVDDHSGTNTIEFLGNVDSYPVTDLGDEPQFVDLKEETGIFLMVPGFKTSFGGTFGTLNGAIASNGIEFFGNAGGTIAGSVLNYSDTPIILSPGSNLVLYSSGFNNSHAFLQSPTPACQEQIIGDLNGDCVVDMVDFAMMSQNWLKKGFVRIFFSPLDASPEWTMEGQWEFGLPTGNGGNEYGNPDPIGGSTGNNVYGVNLNGDYTVAVGGSYCLTTDPFDCNKFHDIKLKFARWLNTDEPSYVTSKVEVSNDGANWHNLWVNTATITDSDWQVVEYDASETADNEEAVYFRWSYEILGDRAYPYSGWNVDDIELLGKL